MGISGSVWGSVGVCVSLWGIYGSLRGSVGPCVSLWGDPFVSMGLYGDLCIPVCPLVPLHTAGSWNEVSIVVFFNPGHSVMVFS